ncbi:MAG: RloB family protein [Bacilli bacterium]|nr:RloB family protein [Bacilli bacterium]
MPRKSNTIFQKNKFYILTNGKESEKNYFELLKCKRSIYKVTIKYCNSDPMSMVKEAIELKNNPNVNVAISKIWCVFDVDEYFRDSNKGREILSLAKNNGIGCAISNLAFEVWLIYHFKEFMNNMSCKNHEQELNKLLKDVCKYKGNYDKTDEKIFEKHLIPRLDKAMTNSKASHQKRIKEYKETHNCCDIYPIWEWNSCTNVYQLIEELKLKELSK